MSLRDAGALGLPVWGRGFAAEDAAAELGDGEGAGLRVGIAKLALDPASEVRRHAMVDGKAGRGVEVSASLAAEEADKAGEVDRRGV